MLVELGDWPGEDGEQLADGARALVASKDASWDGVEVGDLLHPRRSLSVRATSRASAVRDVRWVALKVKDGLVDGQRDRYGGRSDIDRHCADVPLRVWLHRDRSTLLLDTSREPLDRRGYRVETTSAPVREALAAACILASEWDGRGPVVDPMCGSATLLIEAGWLASGRAPGCLRRSWAFESLPGFEPRAFEQIREERLPATEPLGELVGVDHSADALRAARANLKQAGLRAQLTRGDGYALDPPAGPGLVVVNPAHGERLEDDEDQWRRLGDLLKQKYTGWRAVVLAGGESRGKWIGLRPKRRIPVRNGPLDARILLFDLY